MGYSTTTISGLVFDTMLASLKSKELIDDNIPSNAWTRNGQKCFAEMSLKDQPDGGICANVLKMKGENYYRAGSIKITGEGHIIRWATTSKAERKAAKAQACIDFISRHGFDQLKHDSPELYAEHIGGQVNFVVMA